MSALKLFSLTVGLLALGSSAAFGQKPPAETCARPAAGSTITEPENLRSQNGVLKAELSYRNYLAPDGRMRYCYVSKDGSEAPTLRLNPGDMLILSLKNDLVVVPRQNASKVANPAAMA